MKKKRFSALLASAVLSASAVHTSGFYAVASENERYSVSGSCTFSYTVDNNSSAVITGCESSDGKVEIPKTLDGFIVSAIDDRAFFGNMDIISVTIPESVTRIGDYAFSGCLSLKSVYVPDSVTYLGTGCFTGCTDLESAKISASLSAVPDNCFNSCASLKGIAIPQSITVIGKEAFFGCSDISGILIPETVNIIEENALGMHYDIRIGGIEKISGFVIKGLYGTAAETYAESKGISYEFPYGDVDFNGTLDASDATAVLSEYGLIQTSSPTTFDSNQKLAADYNKNGTIDASDATLILSKYGETMTN